MLPCRSGAGNMAKNIGSHGVARRCRVSGTKKGIGDDCLGSCAKRASTAPFASPDGWDATETVTALSGRCLTPVLLSPSRTNRIAGRLEEDRRGERSSVPEGQVRRRTLCSRDREPPLQLFPAS